MHTDPFLRVNLSKGNRPKMSILYLMWQSARLAPHYSSVIARWLCTAACYT